MTKSTILSSLLAFVMLFGIVERSSIATAGGFDWAAFELQDFAASAETPTNDTESSDSTQKKKNSNGFVRALGAPFRAIGRLFSGGKKNEQQARRISNKEAAKFESTKITRVKDASVDAARPPVSTAPEAPAPLDSHLQKGQELLSTGDVNGAIAELSIAVSANAKSGEAQNLLGVAYETKGLRERALESFKATAHLNKENVQFLNNYGFLLYKNNDLEAATKYLKRAAKLAPNDARIWNNLGLAQCQRGNFEDAYESFARAVGEYDGHMNVAIQLQLHGYGKDAIKHLEKAQAIRPNSIDVLTRLVSLYRMTGRATDAENAQRSLVALKTFADANK
jgi:Flp pilus assembly protein TadD